LAADEHAVRYTVGKALDSLWKNLVGVPTWVFGTFLTLALAVYGTIRLWRRDRPTSWLLIGALVVFPVGYVFWWASKLTVSGSTNGLGPHYYLPVLPPLAILAACGAVAIWERRRSLAIATGIAAIVFTAVALPPKLADRRSVTDDHRSVKRVIDQRAPGQALIFDATSKYIMSPYPYLANKPDLRGAVLYAVDRGSADFQLLDRYPTRRPYRLIRRLNPGDSLSKRALVLKPVSTTQAARLNVTVQVRNPSDHPFVIVYLRERGGVERRVIDTNSTKHNVYRFTWTLSPNDVAFDGPPSELLSQMPPLERSGTLTIGVAFANDRSPRDPDRNERRYPYRLHTSPSGPTIEIIRADRELVRFGAPISTWLPVNVARALDVKWSSQRTTSPAPPPPSTRPSGG
jgi:hypothetical protein